MKAFIVESPGKAAIQDVDIPPVGPGDVLVKVKYAGICGTDMAIYTGHSSFVEDGLIRYPIRIGHEWSGIVERVGELVKGIKPGDHVICDNGVVCGECPACKEGRFDFCTNSRAVGTINCWDGCFAEYMLMPQRHVYILPDSIDMENAAMTEPMSIACSGVARCHITAESTVCVIGTGAIGLSAVALARIKGAKTVILIGRTARKLEAGQRIGATHTVNIREQDPIKVLSEITGGMGADYILETSGNTDGIHTAVEIAARHGLIALIGFYEKKLDDLIIDHVVTKELTITGVMGCFSAMAEAHRIICQTGIDLKPMITQRIAFKDMLSVFESAEPGRNIKVMVQF